jgi:hypothetical protein
VPQKVQNRRERFKRSQSSDPENQGGRAVMGHTHRDLEVRTGT